MFLSKKIYFGQKRFPREFASFEPAAPGKPPGRAAGAPKRYFGHKNGYTGGFSVLKNFLLGFCRVPDHFGGFRDGRRPVVGPFRPAMQGGGGRRAQHYLNSGKKGEQKRSTFLMWRATGGTKLYVQACGCDSAHSYRLTI